MCFSEPASFGLAATLAPAGIYCVRKAWRDSPRHLPLAFFPLAFSAQQATEGLVWHGINNEDPDLVFFAARGFVFFSHWFWLFYAAFASYFLETNRPRKVLLGFLTLFGGLFGASLYLPIAFAQDRLTVEVVQDSIEYKTILIYDGLISRQIVRAVYSLVIALALLASSHQKMRIFGGIIVASVLFANWFFGHAFISVWCFLAAALSLFVVYILHGLPKRTDAATDAAAEQVP